MRHYSCHSSAETIAKALTGSYRTEHLFALEQALAFYDAYHEKASACDVRIEAVLKELCIHRGRGIGSVAPAPRRRHRTDQANALAFDVRAALFALLGKDITTICQRRSKNASAGRSENTSVMPVRRPRKLGSFVRASGLDRIIYRRIRARTV